MRKVQAASAAIPCVTHEQAIGQLTTGMADPLLGAIGTDEIQLCPQHAGAIDDGLVDRLKTAYPGTRFRLHASVRLAGIGRHRIVDAGNAFADGDDRHVRRMAEISDRLDAPAYSIHAGDVADDDLAGAFDTVRRLADLFGRPVAIEGMYPIMGCRPKWLLSTWEEHALLLEAGIDYALDLSHLNIVARRHRRREDALVAELLSSPHCIEIHLSGNDGAGDDHRMLEAGARPWWLDLLDAANDDAVAFYEGMLVDPREATRRMDRNPKASYNVWEA